MYYWYKFLTYLFYPFLPIYIFLRKLKKKEHPTRYKEKLSVIDKSRNKGFLMWFHVASVGEAMSILPLIENFEKDKKIDTILITTITLSSSEILKKRYNNNEKIIHQFLPLDVPIFIKKFLKHWNPNISIFIDSEIWPNLIFQIKNQKIPLLLVNGRIRKKTFFKWKKLNNFSSKIFEKFDLCIASNNETENHLKILGAKNIKNYGNLKFARTNSDTNNNLDSDFLNKIKSRKVWCASSTHPTEEKFCGNTHIALKKKYNNVLTIIIPRHINRIKKINKELNDLNLKVCQYTELHKIKNDTDILLIDSYGETRKFYNISKCVFLGKSLIESLSEDSGQNPVEASRFGCKIFHGPNVSNFDEIYNYLKSLGITKQIHNPEELNQSIGEEFERDQNKNNKIIEKIENYGQNILANVIKEIKIYINY